VTTKQKEEKRNPLHFCVQEEPDEHGQGKWEGKQEGKSDERITESRAQQKESTALCTNLED
jgi:hypothetical protein